MVIKYKDEGTMTEPIDVLDASDGLPVYVLVEKLLAIGQTERIITIAREDGNIAIYNTSEGNMVYTGYIDIKDGEFVDAKK